MTEYNYTRVYAPIHLDAAAANAAAIRNQLPAETKIMGAVKADGYGHGAVPIALAIAPFVDGYLVAMIEEAVSLRRHGINKPILILGVTDPSRYEDLLAGDIRTTVFTMEQAQSLSDAAVSQQCKAKIHLAVDTGMNRIGMRADESGADLAAAITKLPGLEVEGLFTHFARADEVDKMWARQQLNRYRHFIKLLDARNINIPYKHCANSAGVIDLPASYMNLVRPGIAIYGMYPSDEVETGQVVLKPVMELKSRIVYIKDIPAGSQIGYGGTFLANKPMRIATIPVGYGDGYPRNLSNRGYVLIRGEKAPIVGRICMDQFMVDITDLPEVTLTDIVTLIGTDGSQQIHVEELAALCGGFHYEVVCNISKRVPRLFMDQDKVVGSKDYFDDIYHGFGGL